MNAPENITSPINPAHEVLLKSDSALCVEDVARAIVGKKPTKDDIKSAAKLLKEIADLGMIEMEPRTGGVPFYRLIVAPKADAGIPASESLPTKTYPPETLRAMIADLEAEKAGEPGFATSPELQYLAPEDYEMPPADPELLAMANKMLGDRLDGVAHVLRGCGLPLLADASGAEDLQPKAAALAGAYQMALADLRSHEACLEAKDAELLAQAKAVIDLRDRLDALTQQWEADTGRITADLQAALKSRSQAINEADRLRGELATERQAREALQEQDGVDVKDAAVGYLVRVTKRKPRYVTKPEMARDAALAAVRAGAGRAEVLALVPVGTARRGAEWQGIQPRTKGD